MSLHRLLQQRAAAGKPVRVGLIGAGKFGSMFLAQVPTMPGLEVAVIADLDPERARAACRTVGWDAARIARTRFVAIRRRGLRRSRGRGRRRGDRQPAGRHRPCPRGDRGAASTSSWSMSRRTCWPGRCSPRRRARAGVVYSLAYGDQPALTCELVDWARACGFRGDRRRQGHEIPAGLPRRHAGRRLGALRPDAGGGAQRRDEPADVQLVPRRHQIGDRDGGGRQRLPGSACRMTGSASRPAASTTCRTCCGRGAGGVLERDGMVEVVSSLERDGRPVFRDLRWGVYVVFEGAERLRRALLPGIRPARPMRAAGTRRCTSPTT